MSDDLDPTIERLRNVDVIDEAAYDDAFFEGLAESVMARIDAGSTEAKVLELPRRRRPVAWMAAAAALAALVVVALLQDPAPTPDVAPLHVDPVLSLDELGAELGRSALADALAANDDDVAAESVASSWTLEELLTVPDDDPWDSGWTWRDELDELSADELDSIITRL